MRLSFRLESYPSEDRLVATFRDQLFPGKSSAGGGGNGNSRERGRDVLDSSSKFEVRVIPKAEFCRPIRSSKPDLAAVEARPKYI